MKIIRFTGKLILPLLAPLLVIPLGILWIILSIVVYVWTAWKEA